MPAFNEARDKTVEASGAISNQRGGTYQDSWALENMAPKHIDAVLRELLHLDDAKVDKRIKRILMAAALCDVKISRWTGGFQYDTVVDTINYEAALGSWWKEFVEDGAKPQDALTALSYDVTGRIAAVYGSPQRETCHWCGLPLTAARPRYLANDGFQYHFECRPSAKARANHADHLPQ